MKHTKILSVILSAAMVTMLSGCSEKRDAAPARSEEPISEMPVIPETDYSDDVLLDDGDDHSDDTAKENESPVMPALSEDEILNMSDEDLWNYADLSARELLLQADTPNPTRSEFGISRAAGYRYVGRWAPASASDDEEALDIATAEWQDSPMNTYENLKLGGKNDEFWLFQCDNYYLGQMNMIDTRMVYNIDYYDAQNETVKFELNEENIRRFFAYRSMEIDIWAMTCLGEYVIDDGDGFTFRKYYINVGGGDWGMHDIAILDLEEWHISTDGKVEYIGETRLRESEIPFRYTSSPEIM